MTEQLQVESSETPPSPMRNEHGFINFIRQIAQRPVALVSMVIVLIFILLAVIGPAVAPYEFDAIQRGEDRRALRNTPPSTTYIMGTDSRGRDIFSRLLWGARDTIGLPAVASLLAVSIGALIGLSTGYVGGWYDETVSRLMDSLLAIPALVLALVMITTIVPILSNTEVLGLVQLVDFFGANNISLTVVIVLLYVPIVTRVVRSATLNVRDLGYIEAAKLRGESLLYILFSEIFPSVLPSLVVEGSLRLSYAIFLVASLGFLGLGVQPPSPEWGRMVLDARNFMTEAPWTMWFPVLAIASLIISINLMSDGMRRVLRNEIGRE
ncbi:MAG: ABC transporter permease [Anaerolineae bacterium]|nr:ABC transporter permease [Anaerolineae bacterium]